MPKKQEVFTTVDELKRMISRAVLIVPDINPKTGQVYSQEVAFTRRPGWSNVNKYDTALPGGKIELSKGDFRGILDDDVQIDPSFYITLEQMIAAGLKAAEREVLEELGVTLAVGALRFVDRSTNKSGWTTYSYVGQLDEKPTLLVKPNSAGTIWLSVETLLNGRPKLLPGHRGIAKRAIVYANN